MSKDFFLKLQNLNLKKKMCLCVGQGLSHDVQHIATPFLVDGARSRLLGDAGVGFALGPGRPSRHHRLRLPFGLSVH